MSFAQPLWIAAGLLCCSVMYLLHLHLEKKRNCALQVFAAQTLLAGLTRNVSSNKRKIRLFLLLGTVFFCFLALARPQYGHRWIDVKRKGIDILFAIDTSASMLAEDIRPNRLERSKFAILDFVNQLEGDRVGLMPFAGSAYLMSPLTVDYHAFEQSLQAVDTTLIPDPGTNLAAAITHAESVLRNDANHKLLIIVTDGENLQGDAIAAASTAAQRNLTIFTVGVGTPEGELIPLKKGDSPEFVKNDSGQFVVSRLDEQSLRDIARKTDGLYAPLGNRGQGLQTIYNEKLILIPKEELAEKRHKVPVERFPWFLGIALLLLFVEYLMVSRRIEGLAFQLPRKLRGKMVMMLFLLPAAVFHSLSAVMASPGEQAFQEEDYLAAAEYYDNVLANDPDNGALLYNYGTAAYKNNLHDEAIASFNRALQSDDLLLQQKAYYNRGNAQFKKGEESLQADSRKTIEHWQDALASYEASLQLQPDNKEAAANHRFVEKKLEELQQRQQEQNKEEKNQGEEDTDSQNGNRNSPEQEPPPQQQDKEGENSSEIPAEPEEQERGGQETTELKEQEDAEKKPQPESSRDGEKPRQGQEGKMSREEARQLLEEMKNEDGTLNFIPKTDHKPSNTQGRNW